MIKNWKNKIRLYTLAGALCLAGLGGFAGCTKTPAGTEATTAGATTQAETVTEENSQEDKKTAEMPTTEEEKKMDWSSYEVKPGSGVYLLTDYIQDEKLTFCSYAVKSEEEALLIYTTKQELNPNHREVVVRSLDLKSGKLKELYRTPYQSTYKVYDFVEEGSVESEYEGYQYEGSEYAGEEPYYERPYYKILNVEPFSFYDYSTGNIYTAGETLQHWQPDLSYLDYEFFGYHGKIYATDYSKKLYEVDQEGAKLIFTLPKGLSYMSQIESMSSDCLSFFTNTEVAMMMGDWTTKYLDYNPEDGTYEAYTLDGSSFYFLAKGDNKGVRQNYEIEKEELEIYDFEKSTKKVLEKSVYNAITAERFISVGNCPIVGETLLFVASSYEDSLYDLYYCDLTETEAVQVTLPKKEILDLSQAYVDYGSVTEMTEAISEKYGVTVYVGENIMTEIVDYMIEPNTNEEEMISALQVVNQTLAMYPEGFFEELERDYLNDIEIYLVGTMTPKDRSISIDNPEGLAWETDGYRKLFLNILDGIQPDTIVHEMAHTIDGKLRYTGVLDEGEWLELSPDDFSYYYGYVDENGESLQFSGSMEYTMMAETVWYDNDYSDVYFYDAYAKTWPTEDRARMMERLIGFGTIDDCFKSEHMREKGWAYAEMIREAFDTSGWTEAPSWEVRLTEMEEKSQ